MRVSAYGGPPVALDPAVNRPLARALIAIDTARTRLGATWTELQSILDAGQTIPTSAAFRRCMRRRWLIIAAPARSMTWWV